MNVKGTKKKNQVVTPNIFEQQELLKKAEVIRENLTASTWHELETNGKFDKNEKLSFISDDMLILGCDVGSETHYMRAIDTRGRELSKSAFPFNNDAERFQSAKEWAVKIAAEHNKSQIVLGLEPTGHYWFCLATWMVSNGVSIVQVNPYAVKQTKEVEDKSQLKYDRKDPKLIANLVKDGNFGKGVNIIMTNMNIIKWEGVKNFLKRYDIQWILYKKYVTEETLFIYPSSIITDTDFFTSDYTDRIDIYDINNDHTTILLESILMSIAVFDLPDSDYNFMVVMNSNQEFKLYNREIKCTSIFDNIKTMYDQLCKDFKSYCSADYDQVEDIDKVILRGNAETVEHYIKLIKEFISEKPNKPFYFSCMSRPIWKKALDELKINAAIVESDQFDEIHIIDQKGD